MAKRQRTVYKKEHLLQLGIEVKFNEKDECEVYRNGKKLTRYLMNAYHKHGRTISYYGYSIYFGKVPAKNKKGFKYAQTNLLEHVLVWLWINEFIPEGFDIDHIDNNKLNNNINNLQLLTRKENLRKRGIGRNQYTYNMTDDEILELRELNRSKHKKRVKK